jgi:hypothetical protein
VNPQHSVVLKALRILALVVLAAFAVILAAPRMQTSYIGAYLRGRCAVEPAPLECHPLNIVP